MPSPGFCLNDTQLFSVVSSITTNNYSIYNDIKQRKNRTTSSTLIATGAEMINILINYSIDKINCQHS